MNQQLKLSWTFLFLICYEMRSSCWNHNQTTLSANPFQWHKYINKEELKTHPLITQLLPLRKGSRKAVGIFEMCPGSILKLNDEDQQKYWLFIKQRWQLLMKIRAEVRVAGMFNWHRVCIRADLELEGKVLERKGGKCC